VLWGAGNAVLDLDDPAPLGSPGRIILTGEPPGAGTFDDFLAEALSTAQLKQKLPTARIFLKRTGDTGHIDFGNVVKYKPDHQVKRAVSLAREKGKARVDGELIGELQPHWMLTLDEHSEENLKRIFLGTKGVISQGAIDGWSFIVDQPAAGSTLFITHAPGVPTRIVQISNVSYQGGGAPVLGVDYTIDQGAGVIDILSNLWTLGGHQFWITYDRPALTRLNYVALKDLRAQGDFIIHEFDHHSNVPRAEFTFKGQCQITNWGELNVEAINEFDLTVVADGKVTVKERK